MPGNHHSVEFHLATHDFGNAGVFDLDFTVPQGSVLGLIGPSGSGKTTTVRLALGLLRPHRGNVRVMGENPAHLRPRTRERIGYLPQRFVLYPNLTVGENLGFAASLYGIGFLKRRGRMKALLEMVELTDARGRLASQLSGGMQRRLLLASALVHEPHLLFADEPTAGVDPVLRAKIWDHFRELRSTERTLVITTQYVGEAAYCDYVGVMREGRLLYVDTPDGLRRRALGGEVLRVVVRDGQIAEAATVLRRLPEVRAITPVRSLPNGLDLAVDDASEAIPVIVEELRRHDSIAVTTVEEYHPAFDEIFVRLMEQAESIGA